ncbi:flavin reductase family protein [Hydrogenibacillus sp. N12]|uniref:flavin reductase family protein n=1 Tax=Hydrogenibacillus sp. N12 TaxID=2866627 RepID=UPI00207BF966|nr:flavin reductase family protein [Hydrogenibacillus sp. N12]
MSEAIDQRELRNCLGRFATGVTVVTYRGEDGGRYGITMNSFTSVSLNPPLILVAIDRRTKAYGKLPGRPFAVNILSSDQEDLAYHFAGKPREGLDIPWVEGALAPRLGGVLATIVCTPWQTYDGGDHVLYLGEVQEFQYRDGDPLVFYRGKMTSLSLDESSSASAFPSKR